MPGGGGVAQARQQRLHRARVARGGPPPATRVSPEQVEAAMRKEAEKRAKAVAKVDEKARKEQDKLAKAEAKNAEKARKAKEKADKKADKAATKAVTKAQKAKAKADRKAGPAGPVDDPSQVPLADAAPVSEAASAPAVGTSTATEDPGSALLGAGGDRSAAHNPGDVVAAATGTDDDRSGGFISTLSSSDLV